MLQSCQGLETGSRETLHGNSTRPFSSFPSPFLVHSLVKRGSGVSPPKNFGKTPNSGPKLFHTVQGIVQLILVTPIFPQNSLAKIIPIFQSYSPSPQKNPPSKKSPIIYFLNFLNFFFTPIFPSSPKMPPFTTIFQLNSSQKFPLNFCCKM